MPAADARTGARPRCRIRVRDSAPTADSHRREASSRVMLSLVDESLDRPFSQARDATPKGYSQARERRAG
jgi:hypothetical protein